MEITQLYKNRFSDFIIVKSRQKPTSKVIVFRNKENFYLYSQNCICFKLVDRNFVLTPLQGIESSLNIQNERKEMPVLKEGLNSVSDQALEELETEFFLNYSAKLKLVYFFKDSKLVNFFHNFYKSGYSSNVQGMALFNTSPSLVGTFAIF